MCCREWYEGVVKVLLVWSDVDPNTPALGGLVPPRLLEWVRGVGRSDVNPNELRVSGNGEPPLWHAATAGHEGVVEILA